MMLLGSLRLTPLLELFRLHDFLVFREPPGDVAVHVWVLPPALAGGLLRTHASGPQGRPARQFLLIHNVLRRHCCGMDIF